MELKPMNWDIEDKGEVLFNESLNNAWQDLTSYQADLIIGIPFYNEKDTLPLILRTIEKALLNMTNYRNPLILSVGDPEGAVALAAIKSMDFHFPNY